jgi:hypothetical protein
VRRVLPDPSIKNIFSPPTPINKILPAIDRNSILIFCVFSRINPRDENEAVLIAKRGGKRIEGKATAYLNLFMTDDTDTIFGKIDRFSYEELGKRIVDYGRPGKSLWAVKGEVRASTAFRMIKITNVRFIGDVDK